MPLHVKGWMPTVTDVRKVIGGRSAAKFVDAYRSDLGKVNTLFACKGTLWNWDMVNSSIRYGLKKKGVTEASAQELYNSDPVNLAGQTDAMTWYVLYKLSLARDTRKTVEGDRLPSMFVGRNHLPPADDDEAPADEEEEAPPPADEEEGSTADEKEEEAPADENKEEASEIDDISIPKNIIFLPNDSETHLTFDYIGGTVEIMPIAALAKYRTNSGEPDLYQELCIQGNTDRTWVDNKGQSLGDNIADLLQNLSLTSPDIDNAVKSQRKTKKKKTKKKKKEIQGVGVVWTKDSGVVGWGALRLYTKHIEFELLCARKGHGKSMYRLLFALARHLNQKAQKKTFRLIPTFTQDSFRLGSKRNIPPKLKTFYDQTLLPQGWDHDYPKGHAGDDDSDYIYHVKQD